MKTLYLVATMMHVCKLVYFSQFLEAKTLPITALWVLVVMVIKESSVMTVKLVMEDLEANTNALNALTSLGASDT